MVNKITREVKISLMLRVGRTEQMQLEYEKGELTFSCAANWINKALGPYNDGSISDMFECVFAHQKDNNKPIKMKDSHGMPMGDNLLIFKNQSDGTCWFRFVPTILTPALCFYATNREKIITELKLLGNKNTSEFYFNLDCYCKSMEYRIENASYLIIDDVQAFLGELKEQIPIAVKNNSGNLDSNRYYSSFDNNNPYELGYVDYYKYNERDLFNYRNSISEEMFWKLKKYEKQSELRIIIPNINFSQAYDPYKKYDYKKNNLKITLPNLCNYARCEPASKIRWLHITNFTNENQPFQVDYLKRK